MTSLLFICPQELQQNLQGGGMWWMDFKFVHSTNPYPLRKIMCLDLQCVQVRRLCLFCSILSCLRINETFKNFKHLKVPIDYTDNDLSTNHGEMHPVNRCTQCHERQSVILVGISLFHHLWNPLNSGILQQWMGGILNKR